MNNNVIPFPKRKRNNGDEEGPPPLITPEDLLQSIKLYNQEDFTLNLIEVFMLELYDYGFDISKIEQEQIHDLALVTESIKSLIARYDTKKHPLQYVATTLFDTSGDTVTMNPNVNFVGIEKRDPAGP